jgi:mersacidin/lichenicidin family type 2 lantibiotic
MNREQIIKAWKDEEYRASLSREELASLPDHPSGLVELTDAQLGVAGGEQVTEKLWSFGCCFGTLGFNTVGCCWGPESVIAPTVDG